MPTFLGLVLYLIKNYLYLLLALFALEKPWNKVFVTLYVIKAIASVGSLFFIQNMKST